MGLRYSINLQNQIKLQAKENGGKYEMQWLCPKGESHISHRHARYYFQTQDSQYPVYFLEWHPVFEYPVTQKAID